MIHSRKARLSAGIVLAVAAALAPLAAVSGPASAATTPGPNTMEPVASGINVSALPGVTVFPGVPANTPETVSFVLRERNLPYLEAKVQQGVKHYLSVSQFASIYGQTPANVGALTSYLAHFGISSDVYADQVDVSTTGTAGEYDKALSVTQNWYQVPRQAGSGGSGAIPAQRVHGNAGPPLLPYRLAKFVVAILGLTNYDAYKDAAMPASAAAKPQKGGSSFCVATFGLTNGCHLPQDFARRYNLDPLYATADGSGQTVGVVTLAAVDPGAPEYFWAHISHTTRTGQLIVDNIDGGPGAPSAASGSVETDLDIEQSGAIAPGANVIDYQAPNTDYGFADAFFTAASQNIASGVSASWGLSETALIAAVLSGQESSGYAAAFDEAFLEMAVQGQSGFTASADGGAYTAHEDIGTTNLSADNPADSPFITACGATSLPGTTYLSGPDGTATATNPVNRIWGWDYLWPGIATVDSEPLATAAEANVVGSGGGFSVLEPEPSYQTEVSGTSNYHAVQYLTPTHYTEVAPGLVEPEAWIFNPTPGVTSGSGRGRAIPDLATNGDPQTGYLVWAPSAGGLAEYGGTSFVDQQLDGANAVIDSYLGHRVGFWNPYIYAAAAGSNSPFTQLNQASTSNDNIYYTGNPGQQYNEGIGLGQPNLAELAGDFTG
jgi:kumamolisin